MDYINNPDISGKVKEQINQISKRLAEVMPEALYRHTWSTLEFAIEMAGVQKNPVDLYHLCTACLLHDYGKIFSYEELACIARKNKVSLSEFEINSQSLIHGFMGPYLVSRDFNIGDEKILKSIKYHTIGYCGMNIEDKILYISDKIEKGRNYPRAQELRKIALKDINLCLIEVYKNNIMYVINKNKFLHPDTGRIWNNICGGI